MQTGERDRVGDLAKTDPAAALEAARRIANPFLRSQALAWVARHAPGDEETVTVAREAAQALAGAEDAWEAVAGVAWPVRALAERGQAGEAGALLLGAVQAAGRIESSVRRVDALFLLVQAGWACAGPAREAALSALLESARTTSSQKTDTVLRDLVLMLAGDRRDFAAALEAIPEGKVRRQVERRLTAREFVSPRDFFW